MHDLEYRSAHVQMAWSQRFRKSEISLDTPSHSGLNTAGLDLQQTAVKKSVNK